MRSISSCIWDPPRNPEPLRNPAVEGIRQAGDVPEDSPGARSRYLLFVKQGPGRSVRQGTTGAHHHRLKKSGHQVALAPCQPPTSFVSQCPQIRSRYDLTDSPEQRWRAIRAVADDASIGNGRCWVGSGDGSFNNWGVPAGPRRSGRRRSRSLTSLLEEAFTRGLTTAIGAGDYAAVVDSKNPNHTRVIRCHQEAARHSTTPMTWLTKSLTWTRWPGGTHPWLTRRNITFP